MEKSSRDFRLRVMILVVAVTLGAISLAAFSLYWVTTRSDAVSVERQVREMRNAIKTGIDEVVQAQKMVTVWDEAAVQLRRPVLDHDWIDANMALLLRDSFGHNQFYILDAEDSPIYGVHEGARIDVMLYEYIRESLQPLVNALRGREQAPVTPDPNSIGLPPASIVRTDDRPLYAAGLMSLFRRPAVVSIMRNLPISAKVPRLPAGQEPLIVSLRFLDSLFLLQLHSRHLIEEPRFSRQTDLRPGEYGLPLVENGGYPIGYMYWRPELPGTKVMRTLAPVTALTTGLMVLLMTLLVRWLFRSLGQQQTMMEELRVREAEAQQLAMQDSLTTLPNRTLFERRLDETLSGQQTAALVLLDLDRFKQVNDTLGHAAGDLLIRQFGERLTALVRRTDIVARLGGDEFGILCRDIRSIGDVEALCERIVDAVRRPFHLLGSDAFVGVSIGICAIEPEDADAVDLMRKADIALYRAKADGRDRYCLFNPAMDECVRMRSTVEEELRKALGGGEGFLLHFQPQIRASDLAIVGFEALVRWQHPTRGLIPPNQFITVAEETGLIRELGEWILREACLVSRRWPDLFMAVNLSPVQFRTPGLADRVIAIVREAGADPRQIELEVTESVLLDDATSAQHALEQLRAAGFRIALDDFGTGYSSLGYLRRFPVDKIKIDRSFIQPVWQSEAAAAIVMAVLTLGHAMGLTVAAEGVETAEQQRFLVAAGCDVMQGYYFSQAVPEGSIPHMIAAVRKRGAA